MPVVHRPQTSAITPSGEAAGNPPGDSAADAYTRVAKDRAETTVALDATNQLQGLKSDLSNPDTGYRSLLGGDEEARMRAHDELLHRIFGFTQARDETHAGYVNFLIDQVKGGASPAQIASLPQFLALPKDRQQQISDWHREQLADRLTGFAPDQNLDRMVRQFAAYHDLSGDDALKSMSNARVQALEPVLGEDLTRQALAKRQASQSLDAADFSALARSIGVDPYPAPSDTLGKAQLGVLRSAADKAVATSGTALTPQQQRETALVAAQTATAGHPLFQLLPEVQRVLDMTLGKPGDGIQPPFSPGAKTGLGRSGETTEKPVPNGGYSSSVSAGGQNYSPGEHLRGSPQQLNQEKVRQLLQGNFHVLSPDNVVTRDGRVWELPPEERDKALGGLSNSEKLTTLNAKQVDRLPELLKDGVRNGPVYYVPRNVWARLVDNSQLHPQRLPYTVITLHHTGNEQTPWQTEDLHRGGQALTRGIYNALPKPLQIFGKGQTYNDPDVGYHFFISRNGDIYEGRGLQYNGEHVGHHNSGNIGVAFLGDYTSAPLTEKQVRSARQLVEALEKIYDIKSVRTHGDWDPVKENELRGAWTQLHGILKDREGP